MMSKTILKISYLCIFMMLSACATQPQEYQRTENMLFKLEKEATQAYKDKKWKIAEKKYAILISETPNVAEVWFMLGNVYARTSRPLKAIASYKEAVIRRADYKQAWRNLGILSLRETAHLYIEMLLYLDHDSEAYIRAKKTSEVLLKLIKKNQSKIIIQKTGKADLK